MELLPNHLTGWVGWQWLRLLLLLLGGWVVSLTLAWEEKWFGQHSSHGDGHSASNFPDEAVQDLAWTLCKR